MILVCIDFQGRHTITTNIDPGESKVDFLVELLEASDNILSSVSLHDEAGMRQCQISKAELDNARKFRLQISEMDIKLKSEQRAEHNSKLFGFKKD